MSHKEFERSIKNKEFKDDLRVLLTEEDREYVQYSLKEFSTYKNVHVLVKSLLSCLKTPEMLDLLPVIRELLPKRHQREYDRLAPYHKMAHPIQRLKNKKGAMKHLQTVWLERSGRTPLGFSIRGGKEMGLGIYVSEVDPGSPSDEAGLRIGDQIIEINGIDFEWLSHSSAVLVFKAFSELKMLTYNSGRLPKFEETGEAFRWIDPLGNSVAEGGQFGDPSSKMGDLPFSSTADKKKVVIKKKSGRSVGLRIRGGKEYKLGIFVVSIDKGSLAEEQGLSVGDQIHMVNGINFRNILHEEAVSILKSSDILMMSVQCVGRIPRLKSQYKRNSVVASEKKQEKPTDKAEATPQRYSFKDGLTDSPKFNTKNKKLKKTVSSPLSTMERRPRGVPMGAREDTSDDNISIEDDENNGSSKFEYGIGTGIMLSTTVHNPVEQQIIDMANKLLKGEDEVAALERKLAEYESSGGIDSLIEFLIITLDTPEKLKMLTDIRCGLKPHDLSKFDKQMSVHEMKARKKKKQKDDGEEEDIQEPSPVVLRPAKETKTGAQRNSRTENNSNSNVLPSTKKPPADSAKSPQDFETICQIVVVKASQFIKNTTELKAINRRLKEYDTNEDLDFLVQFLLTMLDTPKKLSLLVHIRDLIKDRQKDTFDEKVAQFLPKDQSEDTKQAISKDKEAKPTEKPTDKPADKPAEKPEGNVLVATKESPKDLEAIRQKIQTQASKVLKIKDELKGIERRLKQYEANGDIQFLINYLLTIFDSPKKHPVLADIREIIKEKDLSKYDELTSQFWSKPKTSDQPLTSTPKKTNESPSVKNEEVPKPINIPPPPMPLSSKSSNGENPIATVVPDPSSIAEEIKNCGGAAGLRKVEINKESNDTNNSNNDTGPFTDPAAQEVLHKSKSNKLETSLPQTRESFLAWNEDFSHSQGRPKIVISPGKPLHLEIEKTAFFLGIELKESTNNDLVIDDILEDGAAFNDGFLTPGFRVLKVDNKDLNGLTVGDAEALLNEKYDSDKASINLIVVSPPS